MYHNVGCQWGKLGMRHVVILSTIFTIFGKLKIVWKLKVYLKKGSKGNEGERQEDRKEVKKILIDL